MANRYWVGGSGTWDNSSTANWSATSGGAAGASAPTTADVALFDSNSGTAATVTVAATATASATTINKADITLSLSGSATLGATTGTLTLTQGTITLNGYTLKTGLFNASGSSARTINFGTGQIEITGNAGTVFTTQVITNLTVSGTPKVVLSYSGSTGTRTIGAPRTSGGGSASNALSYYVTAGSDTIAFTQSSQIGLTLDFTGFTGTCSFNDNQLYGDLVLVSGMTATVVVSSAFKFINGTTQKITCAGKTIPGNIQLNTAGCNLQLQDNLTLGTTATFQLYLGTLDLTLGNLSTGLFDSSASGVRSILFGSSSITLTGSGTVWTTATVTNFSYTGTPTINVSNNSATATTVSTGSLSEAQALNFNYTVGTYTLTDTNARYKSLSFAGFTGTVPNSVRTIYGDLTLSAGATNSAGANATTFAATSGTQQITTNAVTLDYPLTFNGSGGTFAYQDALTQGSTRAFTITNGTVQLKNGVTSTVGALATSGTNQKVLQSTSAGNQATLSQASGTVNANNLTIKDIAATGGATWNAFVSNSNVDSGNNTGWDFFTQLGKYIFSRRKNKRIFL